LVVGQNRGRNRGGRIAGARDGGEWMLKCDDTVLVVEGGYRAAEVTLSGYHVGVVGKSITLFSMITRLEQRGKGEPAPRGKRERKASKNHAP